MARSRGWVGGLVQVARWHEPEDALPGRRPRSDTAAGARYGNDRVVPDARVQALMALQVSAVMQNNERREMLPEWLLSAGGRCTARPQGRLPWPG